jgi:hypothetical protein
LSYRRAYEATPLRGAASMTVCTNDVALCNLVEHVLPVAVSNPGCDSKLLVLEVVELEDDRVGLAAVSAGVLAEVGHQEDESLFELGFLLARRRIDVALFVGPVELPVIGRLARATAGASLASLTSMPCEFLIRFLCFAARAPSHGRTMQSRQDIPGDAASADPSK